MPASAVTLSPTSLSGPSCRLTSIVVRPGGASNSVVERVRAPVWASTTSHVRVTAIESVAGAGNGDRVVGGRCGRIVAGRVERGEVLVGPGPGRALGQHRARGRIGAAERIGATLDRACA